MNRQHPKVLIVEDEQTVAHYLGRMFQGRFWEVTEAHSLEAAVAALAALPAGFDLILLDLRLPDGSGDEILRTLRERPSRTKVVITSGEDPARLERVMRLQPDKVFTKPCNFDALDRYAASVFAEFHPPGAKP